MIMDTLAGLAFAGEKPLDEYLNEKPKSKNEPVLCGEMLTQIIWGGIWTVALCIGFVTLERFTSLFRYSPDNIYIMCAFFALFVFCGVFNSFNARTTRLKLYAKLTKNKAFVIIIALICAVQMFIIYFGGSLFRCVPLTYDELKCVVLLSLTVIPADLIRKALLRLITCRTHGVENCNYRNPDIGKYRKPHIGKPESCKQ